MATSVELDSESKSRIQQLADRRQQSAHWIIREQAVREFIIIFGDSGYVALYRHETNFDSVYVLTFRYQKEAGY